MVTTKDKKNHKKPGNIATPGIPGVNLLCGIPNLLK